MSINTQLDYNKLSPVSQRKSLQISFNFLTEPTDDYVMMIDHIIDLIDISPLEHFYTSISKNFGRPHFPIRQMLEIVLLAIDRNLSYRGIRKMVLTQDDFKWFARDFKSCPSLATISKFYAYLNQCSWRIGRKSVYLMNNALMSYNIKRIKNRLSEHPV